MDEGQTVEQHLAAWADLVSFLLVGIAILIGEIDPRRRVWGRSPLRNTLLVIFLSLNIVFSVGRFIAEGVLVETGPREFLLISIIYSARWLWLFLGIAKSGTRSAKAFEVARALRELKTIRLGKSTKAERKDDLELVIRSGASEVKGEIYWRGVEAYAKLQESKAIHKVRLLEKELHSNLLDEIGTVQFKRQLETESNDGLYKKFYDLVMTVDSMDPKFPQLRVDYSPFLNRFTAVSADTRQAQRVEATNRTALGDVARRVAADACYYIWHGGAELRTKDHVSVINQCVEDAATALLGVADMGLDSKQRVDEANHNISNMTYVPLNIV